VTFLAVAERRDQRASHFMQQSRRPQRPAGASWRAAARTRFIVEVKDGLAITQNNPPGAPEWPSVINVEGHDCNEFAVQNRLKLIARTTSRPRRWR
jgi:hypothetical protein